jgi:hypothetical protein
MKRAAKPLPKEERERIPRHTGFDLGGAEDVPALVQYVEADLRLAPECLVALLKDAYFIYGGGSEAVLDFWERDRVRAVKLLAAIRKLRKAMPGDRIPIRYGLVGAIMAAQERVARTIASDRRQMPPEAVGSSKADWGETARATFTADLFTLLDTLEDGAKREEARLERALSHMRAEVGDLGARDLVGGNLPIIFAHAFKRARRGKVGEARPEVARDRFVCRVGELMGLGTLSVSNIRKYRTRFKADWKAGLVTRREPQPTSPDVGVMSLEDLPGAALGPRPAKGGTV